MTFRQFCKANNCTRREREELWWYFVSLRIRLLFEFSNMRPRQFERTK